MPQQRVHWWLRVQELPKLCQEAFNQMHGEDEMAVCKLQQGIDAFVADQVSLEALIGAVMARL